MIENMSYGFEFILKIKAQNRLIIINVPNVINNKEMIQSFYS